VFDAVKVTLVSRGDGEMERWRERAREIDGGGASLFCLVQKEGGCHVIMRGRGTRRGGKERDSTRAEEGIEREGSLRCVKARLVKEKGAKEGVD